MQAHAARQGAVGDGAGVVEARPAGAREAYRGVAGVRLVPDAGVDTHESPSPVNPGMGAVNEHVGDGRVVE